LNEKNRYHLLITLLSALLFIPFLGGVHLFDWDEINFAECAREMLVTGDYSRVQLNFQPFWEKPPLFIWLQALSMKLFGVNEFAARFPNAVCGIITLNVLYSIGKKINDHRFALLWVLSYAASFLPFLYFKTGIIDPWFNFFILLNIYFTMLWLNNNTREKTNLNSVYAGIFAGLAVLTKGPVALIIIGLTVLIAWLRLKFNPFANLKNILLFVFALLLSGFSWFIYEILSGHMDIVKEFIAYQIRLFNTEDSDHGGFMFYHFVVLLVGCFPASVFFIPAHGKSTADTPFQVYVKKWMLYLFWVVLILFTIVKTKILHYSSMCYFPLTYLAAHSLYNIIYREKKFNKILLSIGAFLTVAAGIAFTCLPLIEKFKSKIISSGMIKDDFAIASLQTTVSWSGVEWLAGVLFLIAGLYFLFRIYKSSFEKAVFGLFITSLLTCWLLTLLIIPKVEPYSQGPAIEFYESLKGKDCYVETIGFKSYAYMFYTDRQPSHNSTEMISFIKRNEEQMKKDGHSSAFSFNLMSLNWMLYEKLDKPAYFVMKVNEVDQSLKENPSLKELYRKGGFAFLIRNPGTE